jgi:hypothetical protein
MADGEEDKYKYIAVFWTVATAVPFCEFMAK